MKLKKKKCDKCSELKIIWKNYEGKRFCKQCWGAHSGKPKPIPSVQKRLPSRSPKKIKQDQIYSQKRKEFLTLKPMCEAHIPGVCLQVAGEVHHKKGRVGDLYLDETHWLAVCRGCHYWIEMRPEAAKALGFSSNRL